MCCDHLLLVGLQQKGPHKLFWNSKLYVRCFIEAFKTKPFKQCFTVLLVKKEHKYSLRHTTVLDGKTLPPDDVSVLKETDEFVRSTWPRNVFLYSFLSPTSGHNLSSLSSQTYHITN